MEHKDEDITAQHCRAIIAAGAAPLEGRTCPKDRSQCELISPKIMEAEAIPALPMLVFLFLTGLIAVFGMRRLRAGAI